MNCIMFRKCNTLAMSNDVAIVWEELMDGEVPGRIDRGDNTEMSIEDT